MIYNYFLILIILVLVTIFCIIFCQNLVQIVSSFVIDKKTPNVAFWFISYNFCYGLEVFAIFPNTLYCQ